MNSKFGFARVTVCSPEVVVGNPQANADNIIEMIKEHSDSDVIVFPELCITGYTCGDLFKQRQLIDEVVRVLDVLAKFTSERNQLIFVGAPIALGTELFNCAVALHDGWILGVVPKQNICEGGEFYEGRHFAAANGDEPEVVTIGGHQSPFGTDLLFRNHDWRGQLGELVVFAEVCQDVWMPLPPSSFAALYGANLGVNLSASPEQVEKFEYREDLIKVHSGKNYMAYAYSAAGPSENTSDLVFSGDCMIAENWRVLARSSHIGDGKLNFGPRSATADIDYQMLTQEKRNDRSFGEMTRRFPMKYRYISWYGTEYNRGPSHQELIRQVNGTPFIPLETESRKKVCASVFDIQCAGFHRRWKAIGFPDIALGVSGGSDSTHMLNVLERVCKISGQPLMKIKARSLPGFGTSEKTKNIGETLCKEMGIPFDVIDIRHSVLTLLNNMGHKPFGIDLCGFVNDFEYTPENSIDFFMMKLQDLPVNNRKDLVFENMQARVRTNILMGLGFMVGTGDLSESAEGWTTFGGDHLSNYNPNAGVPKTLIKWLIEYVAKEQHGPGKIRDTLLECAGLPFSPELLPLGKGGEIAQSTEDEIGSYELIDFFMMHIVRYGFTPEKILYLSDHASFSQHYEYNERKRVLEIFYKRFFSNQFKRNCMPDGPKIGSVSLSPRGDWRMPADADPMVWLKFFM